MMEYLLIAVAWLVFIAIGAYWFWDYNKKAGFKYLIHSKDFGKRVL